MYAHAYACAEDQVVQRGDNNIICTGLMLPNAHINSWSVFVFFSVWLYHERKFIGSGLLRGERHNIHGYPVAPDDSGVQLEHVPELDFHPRYGYPLEAGSFTTWPRADFISHKSQPFFFNTYLWFLM